MLPSSMGPSESITQTTSRSVQPFLHSSWQCCRACRGMLFPPKILPICMGQSGLPSHGSLIPLEPTIQTVSQRSVQPWLGVSTGTRASGYLLSNGYPGSKISARVGTVGPPVVINTSWLAKISAAMKSYTPRVVVALLSATEASHLSGRQGPMRWGELGGYVD